MTLSIQTGLSGILAAQTALNLTGQNVANVETTGYARRTLSLASAYASNSGGVVVGDVRRVTNDVVQARLFTQTAAYSQSEIASSYLQQVESLLNEPGDYGLNALLDQFFGGFADLGLDPENAALRTQVTETASRLADTITQLRADVASILDSVTSDIQTSITRINDLLDTVVNANASITAVGLQSPSAYSLMDTRQAALDELSKEAGLTVIENGGLVRVYFDQSLAVGETMAMKLTTVAGAEDTPVWESSGAAASLSSGRLAGLVELAQNTLPSYLDSLDELAASLIYEVNNIHAEGVGLSGSFDSVQALNAVSDPSGVTNGTTLALDSAGLAFTPQSGDLYINITNTATETTATSTIALDAAAMSLDDLAQAISALTGVNATISSGRLTITAESGYLFDFAASQGTDLLACLGVNGLFAGSSARDIALSSAVEADPNLVAAASKPYTGDGANATRIASLQTSKVLSGGSATIQGLWQSLVTEIGGELQRVQAQEETQATLVAALTERRQSVSGVSLDEEAVRLLEFQQMYSACARYVSSVNSLLDNLIKTL